MNEDKQKVNPSEAQQSGQTERNAIPVGKKFVMALRSALMKGGRSIDKLPSDREILDFVVHQAFQAVGGNYVYYAGGLDENTYKWFDSDMARTIQANPEIKDKRRFTEAMILAYLVNPDQWKTMVIQSRLLRPRAIPSDKAQVICRKAAEIADAKDAESTFEPATLTTVAE